MIDDALDRIRDVWHDESNQWLDEINALTEPKDPRVIRPLLCVWPFEENDDYHHWMFAVAHAVERYPLDVLAPEFAASVPDLNDTSPYFLEFLLGRWLNSPSDFDTLLENLLGLPTNQQQIVADMLGRLAAQRTNNEIATANWANAKPRFPVA